MRLVIAICFIICTSLSLARADPKHGGKLYSVSRSSIISSRTVS